MQCYFFPPLYGHNIPNIEKIKRGAGASAQQRTVFVAIVVALPNRLCWVPE